jgi:hypothetical protein
MSEISHLQLQNGRFRGSVNSLVGCLVLAGQVLEVSLHAARWHKFWVLDTIIIIRSRITVEIHWNAVSERCSRLCCSVVA